MHMDAASVVRAAVHGGAVHHWVIVPGMGTPPNSQGPQ